MAVLSRRDQAGYHCLVHSPISVNREANMARTLEQERAAIEEDARKLDDRRQRLEMRERDQAIQAVEKAGILKLELKRLAQMLERIRALGIDEVEKRLSVKQR